ncbi:MAG: hypothetical protein IKD43_03755 [Clostridia bacterium]|nr:hypothetical protein [Clostridia bacterium]
MDEEGRNVEKERISTAGKMKKIKLFLEDGSEKEKNENLSIVNSTMWKHWLSFCIEGCGKNIFVL